jgi:uncharacterized protein YbjT (DUF2867 family)
MPFTILRPGYFFQNDLGVKELLTGHGVYPMPIGTAGISGVDVSDIAEAAATALTGDGHQGQTYHLVGPDVLTGPGVAALWSRLLGRTVHYAGEGFDQWEEQMRSNAPGWVAHDLRVMFEGFAERGLASTPAQVERFTALLGHAPRAYESFAAAAAATWQGA